jgi:glycosyltransferase involved in cell wall biosynthesis
MQHIRVGMVTSSFPLERHSTSGVFILRLIQNLPPNIITTVVTPASNGNLDCTMPNGVTISPFRYAPRRWQILAHKPGGIPAALGHKKLLYFLLPFFILSAIVTCLFVSRKIDLFHANWSINGVIAGIAAKIARIPLVTTLRGSDVNRAETSLLYRLLLRACIRLSDRIVTVSDALNSAVQEQFPDLSNVRLLTICNGVDQAFLNIPFRDTSTNNYKLRLITIGNLTRNKGVDQIISALSQLDKERYTLKIIGDGPEKLSLEALASSLGLINQVIFSGSVPPDEIPNHLAGCDIFILASHSEGRANVVLEAMAAGLPVVVTSIAGMEEIVKDGETGLLFPNNDIKTLVFNLVRLDLDPELRQRLGRAGREFVRAKRLAWQITAEAYASLYKNLVRHHKMH